MKDQLLEDSLSVLAYLTQILDYSGEEEFVTIKLSPEFFIPAREILKRAKESYTADEVV